MGRPASELYRGARLSQALEWQHNAHPDLTAIESNFLEASAEVRDAERPATEQLASSPTAHPSLLVGVVALLRAVAAGLLAIRQQRDAEAADLAAAVAEAGRVDDGPGTPRPWTRRCCSPWRPTGSTIPRPPGRPSRTC